jgi:poly-D-alanine transfer protein DltD
VTLVHHKMCQLVIPDSYFSTLLSGDEIFGKSELNKESYLGKDAQPRAWSIQQYLVIFGSAFLLKYNSICA